MWRRLTVLQAHYLSPRGGSCLPGWRNPGRRHATPLVPAACRPAAAPYCLGQRSVRWPARPGSRPGCGLAFLPMSRPSAPSTYAVRWAIRRERSGELVNTLVEGIEALDAYFSQYLPQIALAALVPLTVLVFVAPLDLLSGLVLLLTAPLIPVFMILIGSLAEGLSRRQWGALAVERPLSGRAAGPDHAQALRPQPRASGGHCGGRRALS